ncbi:CopG family transcriptional regulator [Sphingobium phenoxybenzoativorans]|uniref:CopG family transcriptional regulator n=1 Tax=Sphingobium phenoxybenzoativorans TaxID=1592790 RepID=A0A975Q2Z1_9SPHN|nr:CopG family transcriptional regulator [Sphingobium phenoxybenzoativorans]QUT06943.1 CopG family transcriptional regulator [Sphingobium phenoxybenzoativorans]
MKVRQNLYIDREISDALEALAAGHRGNKSRLVNDALRGWLARRGSKEIDDLLKIRLDRMSREISATRRDIDILLESLAVFVRYQLNVTAPLAEADAAGRAVGRDRFEAFITQVGRQIASNVRTLAPGEPKGDGL